MEESKQNKIVLLRQMIENAERNIVAAKQILSQIDSSPRKRSIDSGASQIIEGAFDGEKMMGLDGKKYPIPVNYASKSKLIEGDLLKLTITEDGSFVYKQISPADRRKIIGTVMKDSNGKFYVSSEGRKYNVLLASLTYFKADEGDEVAIIVPKEKISKWAAIEAVIEDSEREAVHDTEDNKEFIEEDNIEQVEDSFEEKGIEHEEADKNELIEDEWTPDIEEMKKEAQFDENKDNDSGISDDLS
ncbi:MAG: hypothetical protein KAU07_03550 [Candidatus Andersenbacteria bacterium]|nr:hypothetical protein [Candidatus Andersenbacteria bacterium]